MLLLFGYNSPVSGKWAGQAETRAGHMPWITLSARTATAADVALADGLPGGDTIWRGRVPASGTLHVAFNHPLPFSQGVWISGSAPCWVSYGYE